MILFVFGSDGYRVHHRALWYRKGFAQKYAQGKDAYAVLDGGSVTADQVQDQLRVGGLFVHKNFVHLKNFAQSAKAAERERALAYLEQWKAGDSVLLWTEELPQDAREQKEIQGSKLWRVLLEAAKPEHYDYRIGDSRWVQDEAEKRGLRLSPAVIRYLAQTSVDAWSAATTLDALQSFDTSEITEERVRELFPQAATEDAFGMIDAIGAKNFRNAEALIASNIMAGKDALEIMAQLQKHLGLLIRVTKRGYSEQDLVKEVKVHPFVAKKAAQQAKMLGVDLVTQLVLAAADAELQLKSSSLDPLVVYGQMFDRVR